MGLFSEVPTFYFPIGKTFLIVGAVKPARNGSVAGEFHVRDHGAANEEGDGAELLHVTDIC